MGRHIGHITAVVSANGVAYSSPGSTGAAIAAAPMRNVAAAPDRPAADRGYYHGGYYAYNNVSEAAADMFYPLNGTAAGRADESFEKPGNCQWIPAQQSLFQFSNICFLTAFIVPRSYKLSVLSLRYVLLDEQTLCNTRSTRTRLHSGPNLFVELFFDVW